MGRCCFDDAAAEEKGCFELRRAGAAVVTEADEFGSFCFVGEGGV